MSDAGEPFVDAQGPEFGAMEDRVYDAYQDQRNKLLEAEQDYGRSYDKYMLTLSGGALGLSLTFIKGVAPSGDLRCVWLVVVAWALLVVTVAIVLVMMRLTQDGHEEYRAILDEECARGGERFWQRVRERQSECRKPTIVGCLSKGSLLSFCVGVVLLFLFTFVNLSARGKSNEQQVGEFRESQVTTQPVARSGY